MINIKAIGYTVVIALIIISFMISIYVTYIIIIAIALFLLNRAITIIIKAKERRR